MDLNDRDQIRIKPIESKHLRRVLQQKIDSKTKPFGALGFLEDLVMQAGLVFETASPEIQKPALLVFAADHGIVEAGVSQFSKEVTYQVVLNFLHEASAVNVFARNAGLDIKMVDVGVDHAFEGTLTYWLHHGSKAQSRKIGMGTKNFMQFPAMTTAETERALETGARLTEEKWENGCNTIGYGDIAVGNYSSGLALCCALYEQTPDGLAVLASTNKSGNDHLKNVREVVDKALRAHPKTHDPITILALYGGFEIAAMVGGILKAAQKRMLVLIDGFIATVALTLAERIVKGAADYCVVCQHSGEGAHSFLLSKLEKKPILDLNVNIGEGCGVALALPIVQNAMDFLKNMSSFDDVISDKQKD